MPPPSPPPASIFSRHSSYIENCIRHIFLASVTQSLWLLDQNKRVQIFTSEVDDFGYDIVLTLDAVTRHIQLKQTHTDAKAVKADINVALSQAKGGGVSCGSFTSLAR